ncbi:hypothetical protein FBU59_002057 [Linderina macrospora]|uniref:Uncharacterized protein n=1 Tax=Linderina macrospora TaxID=4868 RepID=A0ACC1JCJ2_9FUNG|nr:hypothetical protein FBU59_002057 [Linderina macrospora]
MQGNYGHQQQGGYGGPPPPQGGYGGPQGGPPPPQGGFGGPQGGRAGAGNRGFQWISCTNGHIPPNAVQGGIEKDGKPLFVARAMYKGGLHPGKAGPHIQKGGCAIGWGHDEINVSEYQVLVGDASQLRWVKQEGALSVQGFVPVQAGHEETGEPLYIAKTLVEGSQQLGKCAPHIKKGMSYPYGHKERDTKEYQVLAYTN